MRLYFASHRAVWRVGDVAGIDRSLLAGALERYRLPAGTPVLLDEAMRPVEPVSSWFRSLALARRDAKSMRAYAYTVLMLLGFLQARGTDLRSATEMDILQFRQWRREDTEGTVGAPAGTGTLP
ncbi:site-specific integrase [Streptomyces sp. NPDC059851]|uniref:site-specific integrase n=1 Tax=Streptomyces sp. NPDC059851 TaxID=3346971 RepID=UPI00365555B5